MIEDVLTRAASEAHESWLKTDRQGPGRLVRENLRYTDIAVAGRLLSASRFESCVFTNSVLSSAHLQDAELVRCTFNDCILMLAKLHGALILDCTVRDSSLAMMQAKELRIKDGSFSSCDFERANMVGSHVANVTFDDCKWSHTDLSATRFHAVRFLSADLSGANLSGANFEACDLSSAQLPTDHGATLLRCKR
tara:strand:- start:10848 stop:11429 length:582 start_codon:yes stop_codon:yes gene_type:complete